MKAGRPVLIVSGSWEAGASFRNFSPLFGPQTGSKGRRVHIFSKDQYQELAHDAQKTLNSPQKVVSLFLKGYVTFMLSYVNRMQATVFR